MAVTARFATADIDPIDRMTSWTRTADAIFGKGTVETRSIGEFSSELVLRSYGDVGMIQLRTTPIAVRHLAEGPAPQDPDHVVLEVQDVGTSDHTLGGSLLRFTPGTFAMAGPHHGGGVTFNQPSQFFIVKLPTERIASRVGPLAPLLHMRVDANHAALLTGFLRTLVARAEPAADDGWDSAIGDVIVDLAALSYQRAGSAAAPAGSQATQRWQRAVRDFIDRRLHDPELSVAMTARHLDLSPRYVQMVFAGMATTFTAYVIARRLELAAQLLTSERPAIAEVALRVGFADASHFYRSFRKRFGVSPGRFAAQRR